MSLSSLFSDIYTSLTISPAHADAPPAEEHEEPSSDSKVEEEKKSAEPEPKEAEPVEEESEAEEAEEEEPEDTLPAITEECSESKECKPAKHHYGECVARVTAAEEGGANGPKEDCVEEFFHLVHCSAQCAAPQIWAKLK
ncbi:ubiquinol-cytochrome C reductase hinge protein-domain-containing protein [Tuber borchii]|uniref:Cytochrome b-c1 complex subunit 6, mitochondrial n=1 Tax=Tuber borchii TaxID=42251 RepID=A0A2T6ZD30_TUBBO|nr:ubiquinol-cytochrome C reductase hinge protein-domain-containing protein [Tuber borchii]